MFRTNIVAHLGCKTLRMDTAALIDDPMYSFEGEVMNRVSEYFDFAQSIQNCNLVKELTIRHTMNKAE